MNIDTSKLRQKHDAKVNAVSQFKMPKHVFVLIIGELLKMPFSIFEKKICYATFVTQDQVDEPLLRCSRCQCAFYKSKEHQKAHWKIHKAVCKRPDFERVRKMTGTQCLDILKNDDHNKCFDHNTAAIFERLFDLIRTTFDSGDNELDDLDLGCYGMDLHFMTRLSINHVAFDRLEPYYERAWACPGIPQLLFFTDLRNTSCRKLMKNCPNGYPSFSSKADKLIFDKLYNFGDDLSGEEIAWFIVGFLVRSRVWGPLTRDSRHDGQGHLRDTNYAKAATTRIGQIFSSRCLRKSLNDVCFPFLGFFLNIAENRPEEFHELIEAGITSGLLQYATVDYCKRTLMVMDSIDISILSNNAKLDLLEVFCSIFDKSVPLPWSIAKDEDDIDLGFDLGFSREDARRGDDLSNQITKICLNIACAILNGHPNILTLLENGSCRRLEKEDAYKFDGVDFNRRRMALAYLQNKFLDEKYTPSTKDVREWIKAWAKVDEWDKVKFAKQVMEDENLHIFIKRAAERKRRNSKKKK